MAIEAEPSHQYSVTFAVWDTWQSDRMTSDMIVHSKKRSGNEFLLTGKIAPVDNQCLLNVYGDQTVNVNTVRCVLELAALTVSHLCRCRLS